MFLLINSFMCADMMDALAVLCWELKTVACQLLLITLTLAKVHAMVCRLITARGPRPYHIKPSSASTFCSQYFAFCLIAVLVFLAGTFVGTKMQPSATKSEL